MREVRLERLRPADVRETMARSPIAWVPLGAIEFHAEHLPLATDGFTAQALLERAAARAGGAVLPWSSLTLGTLHLPWSFRFDHSLVEATLRATIGQVATQGARVVVVHTGHGPLDLIRLIKRVCAEAEVNELGGPGFRAHGVCYQELNASLGVGLGSDWPVAIDHGSIVEISWVMAIAPELVAIDRLPADPGATMIGVYGPNPRDLSSEAVGSSQHDDCALLLADRAARMLEGERLDPFEDLRGFVARYWPERLEVGGRAGTAGAATMTLRNPGPVSRYLTGLSLRLDGRKLDPTRLTLASTTTGEAGAPVAAASLGPKAGFYVRRQQAADIRLPAAVPAGPHRVRLEVGLAGVSTATIDAKVDFV